jgi:hypothetical protein
VSKATKNVEVETPEVDEFNIFTISTFDRWVLVKSLTGFISGIKQNPTVRNTTTAQFQELFMAQEGRRARRPSKIEIACRELGMTFADLDAYHAEYGEPGTKRSWRKFADHVGLDV